jgi:hypothetical protein
VQKAGCHEEVVRNFAEDHHGQRYQKHLHVKTRNSMEEDKNQERTQKENSLPAEESLRKMEGRSK